MKKRNRLVISFLGTLFALTPLAIFATQAPVTITVVATFDYPGTGNSTYPFGINLSGEVAGYYVDSSGVTRAFTRTAAGVFSRPIVEPRDTGGYTRALGVNAAKTLCGDFFNVADNMYHGFFLTGRTFTQYDFGGLSRRMSLV